MSSILAILRCWAMAAESRQRFLGRHLMVKGEYVDDILAGRKKATIRLGRVRVKYKELIVHGGGRPIAKVRVTGIRYKRVSELTDEDARIDGFRGVNELLAALERAYGRKPRPDEVVTIIEFEVVQDLSKLEPEDPYLGLQSADIARLALRYLDDLSEEDRKILRDLTVTNSIRASAYRLYHDLGKRWLIRRVLRRALRRLIERGILNVSGRLGEAGRIDKNGRKRQRR